MLDFFIQKGFVELGKEGEVKKLPSCPEFLEFEENRDGAIVFMLTFPDGRKRGISEPEEWEFIENNK